uniref:7TM_GPCR_Srx domain-containing protein n=1 Tax=Strongyloides venezuelensis TaxID=75913 RepID=A0A0K0FC62_STRVS
MNSTTKCFQEEFMNFFNSISSLTISFHKIPKEKYHNTPLPLMRHHGVASFIQQLCHLVTSIRTIFFMRWRPIIVEIIGAILESSFLCGVAFILVLSLNRCDLMYNYKFFPSMPRKKFYSIATILCYAYFCLMMIFFLLPNYRLTFDLYFFEWDFAGDMCSAYYGFLVKKWAVYIPLIASFILYVLTFYKIIYLRSLKQKSTYLYPEDIKIIINVIISYVFTIAVELFWNGELFNIYETQVGALIPHIMYIIISGANTTFTLFTVRDIRKSVSGMCCSKSIISSFHKIPKKRFNNSPLPLMRHHSILSFIQQLCHSMISIRTIFYMRWIPIFIEIIGAILEAAYLGSILFILVMSLNRCDLMYNYKFFPSVQRKKFYSIAAIFCYVYSCLMLIFFSLPDNRFTFSFKYYEWNFVKYDCSTYSAYVIEVWAVYGVLILSFILYVLTFSRIIYLRSLKKKATYFYPEDINLIIHLLICYVLLIVNEIFWNAHYFNIYETQLGALIPHLVFIIISGANTTFSLFFVRDLRKSVFGRCQSKSIIEAFKFENFHIKV